MNPFKHLAIIVDQIEALRASVAVAVVAAQSAEATAAGHCQALTAIEDRLDRIETVARRTDGRLERLELYLLRVDPAYPVSQVVMPLDEVERHRARLAAALNGETHAGRD